MFCILLGGSALGLAVLSAISLVLTLIYNFIIGMLGYASLQIGWLTLPWLILAGPLKLVWWLLCGAAVFALTWGVGIGGWAAAWALWVIWNLILWKDFQEGFVQVVILVAGITTWFVIMGNKRFSSCSWHTNLGVVLKTVSNKHNERSNKYAKMIEEELATTVEENPGLVETKVPFINPRPIELSLSEMQTTVRDAFNEYFKIFLFFCGGIFHLTFISGHFTHLICFTVVELFLLLEMIETINRNGYGDITFIPTRFNGPINDLGLICALASITAMILISNSFLTTLSPKLSTYLFNRVHNLIAAFFVAT